MLLASLVIGIGVMLWFQTPSRVANDSTVVATVPHDQSVAVMKRAFAPLLEQAFVVAQGSDLSAWEKMLSSVLPHDTALGLSAWIHAVIRQTIGDVDVATMHTLLSGTWTLELRRSGRPALLLQGSGERQKVQTALATLHQNFAQIHPAVLHERRTFDGKFTIDMVRENPDASATASSTQQGWSILDTGTGADLLLTAQQADRFIIATDHAVLAKALSAELTPVTTTATLFGSLMLNATELPSPLQTALASFVNPRGTGQWNLLTEPGHIAIAIPKL